MNAEQQQQIRREAARWLAALHSGEVDAQRQAQFVEWQARSPEHARCIAQLSERLGALQGSALRELSRQGLQRTLDSPSSRRQFLRDSLALGATAVAATLLSRVGSSGFIWPGDLYTGIAERNDFELEDGSRLTLNAASRVSPRFAAGQRGVVLQAGELLLQVRAEPRPFQIEINSVQVLVEQQQVRAPKLLLRHEPEGCYAVALDSDLQLHHGGRSQALRQGHWARLDGSGQWRSGVAQGSDTLWLRGLLEADGLPLRQVIEALRPYRRGILQLSPRLTELRVSGMLPLDDTDHALAMLASIAPIKLQRRTELWVSIEPA